ncbi:MAG TPA: AAA family ATPase [Candidatus Saccharimonadales bacterium]
MDTDTLDYLQRQLSLGKQRLRRYVINLKGKPYPKRNIYVKTKKYVDSFMQGGYEQKRWVIIPGLRGTGKTTILAQIYYELESTLGDDINLLYFSLDEVTETIGSDLNSLLKEYERLLGESYEALTKPTFILVDEVQSDPKWAAVLKSLNDRAEKVFLLCSGSSAVHIQASADIPGRRAAIERLYPMNFCEFEMVRYDYYPDPGLKGALHKAVYSSANASESIKALKSLSIRVDRYWSKVDRNNWRYYLAAGSLPFALLEKSYSDVHDAVLSSVDKVVTKDIHQLGKFSSDTIPIIKRLLFILAESDAISHHRLNELLGISKITVANILDVLVQAELLIKIPAQGSQANATKKASKYLFMSSVVRAAFYNIAGSQSTNQTREGRLLEDVVGLHLYREFGPGAITYDSTIGGADFILKTGASQIALEVGRGTKTNRQVLSTMKRVNCKYGVTISSSPLSLSENSDVVMLPWDFFALM